MSNKNLTQIVARDKDGKPILNLKFLKGINVYTATPEEQIELTRIYNCGGRKLMEGLSTTELYFELISLDELCKREGITSEMRKQINDYFDNKTFLQKEQAEEPFFIRDDFFFKLF
jgi:hypothetical protein